MLGGWVEGEGVDLIIFPGKVVIILPFQFCAVR